MKSTTLGAPYVVFGALLLIAITQFDQSLVLVAAASYVLGSMVVYSRFESTYYRASSLKLWGAFAINAAAAVCAALAYKLITTGSL